MRRTIKNSRSTSSLLDSLFFSEQQFKLLLARERKRSERTKSPFLLVVVSVSKQNNLNTINQQLFQKLQKCIVDSSREIDIRGWYTEGEEAGVIFTDVKKEATEFLLSKLKENILFHFEELALHFQLRFALFPNDDSMGKMDAIHDPNILFPDLADKTQKSPVQRVIKRTIDATASGIALAVLLPFLALVAILVKATSKGPVFFRQQRIGYGGRPFTMFKFRSMKMNCDTAIHKEFIEKHIKGGFQNTGEVGPTQVFKIKNDHRLTPIGEFLRKSSIDELPQLFNVLSGDMSLVGPRPPIAYEVDAYDMWHHRRLNDAQPGITGLWQVEGRSRTTFDDMVRMDIRYAEQWSLWLDMKLLMKTPIAVVAGKGAY